MRNQIEQTLKTVLISLLISLNVCIWRDVFEEIFDQAVFGVMVLIFGFLFYGKIFHDKGRWR